MAIPRVNLSFTGSPKFCLHPRYRSVVCTDASVTRQQGGWRRAKGRVRADSGRNQTDGVVQPSLVDCCYTAF
jgi:hypothetical protein